MQRVIRAVGGLLMMPFFLKQFDPRKVFKGKRIAIVGPADSAFDVAKGSYIDGFDYIIRINKAVIKWDKSKQDYLGSRTDILYHSFFENDLSGGGELNFDLFNENNIEYVVNPRNDFNGKRLIFNFYKKYLQRQNTYLLSEDLYRKMMIPFGKLHPTIGYAALFSALNSSFAELFITGFTFFKTPYSEGYRDHLVDMKKNQAHIKEQGIHDPELEFQEFIKMLKINTKGRVLLDKQLKSIVASQGVSDSDLN